MDSLFIASYDSQGYGGGSLTHLHTGRQNSYRSTWYIITQTRTPLRAAVGLTRKRLRQKFVTKGICSVPNQELTARLLLRKHVQ
jgi:hypothetical protein